MKIVSAIVAVIIMVFSFASPSLGSPSNTALPDITSESAVLIDITTGQTLFAKNPDLRLEPASTTKIMTALLALEKGNLSDIVTAGPSMLNKELVEGTRIYLEPGEQMTLENLLYAALLNSANDAAVAIAEHISGDTQTFTALMNSRASEIGALSTTFKNPSGLSEDGHLTTASDLALIARTAYNNPVFRAYVSTKTKVIPRNREGIPTEMYNMNEMLWTEDTVTGMKTGYTSTAGNTFVASATRDGHELIGVVLKSPSKTGIYTDMRKLFQYGFTNFEDLIKPEVVPALSPTIQPPPVASKISFFWPPIILLALFVLYQGYKKVSYLKRRRQRIQRQMLARRNK